MRGNSKKIDGSESRVGYYPTQLTKKGKDTCILCKATTKNRAAMASPRIRTMRGLMSAFNAGGMDGGRRAPAYYSGQETNAGKRTPLRLREAH